jgi:uncharacterized RDD family membrane protein YckC
MAPDDESESGRDTERPLWLPPRRPEPEPDRPIGPQGFLPPRPPGGDARPAGRWDTSTPPPAPASAPSTTTSAWGPEPAPWTPQGVVLASWGSRAGAALIDAVVIAAVFAAALVAFLGLLSLVDGGSGAGTVWLVVVLLFGGALAAFSAAVLYAPVMLAHTNGQTLGKMALGIRVIRTSGGPIDFGYAFLREVVVKALAVGVAGSATFGIAQFADLLWPLWDDQNRALHDMVAQSRVIRAR